MWSVEETASRYYVHLEFKYSIRFGTEGAY